LEKCGVMCVKKHDIFISYRGSRKKSGQLNAVQFLFYTIAPILSKEYHLNCPIDTPHNELCSVAGLLDWTRFRYLFTYSFSRPIEDPTELHNVGVSQRHQLFGGLLAAISAAAVYKDQLILIRKFWDII